MTHEPNKQITKHQKNTLPVSSWKKTFLFFALVFGSSLLTTACGSAKSNQSTAASTGSQPQASAVNQSAQNGNSTTIKIGYVKWALLPIVRERGTLEKDLAAQNIQINWVGPFPNFAPLLETLNARSTDIASGGSIPVITGLAGGADICLIAYRPPDLKSQTIVVPKNSPVRQVSDLVGKKVAVNKGGAGELVVLQALKQAKIPENKVERVYLGPTDALPALLQGHVDAWAIWDPGLSTAEEQYGARRLVENNPAPSYGVYVVRRPVLAEHPQAVKAIVDILKQEGEWTTNNPEKSATILEKAMGLSPAVIKRVVANRPPEKVLPLEPKVIAEIQEIADWMLAQKVIPKRVDVASAVCPTVN
ncbi:aliphatic sulfonate ABC transporter substrate-binding protein [Calothrix sp. FACHB-156]|nr:aliphatic sulfonate ABC transporter substrate-binding protein [Calothrix sp. FACHB-156]